MLRSKSCKKASRFLLKAALLRFTRSLLWALSSGSDEAGSWFISGHSCVAVSCRSHYFLSCTNM
jgi:hypothetical protein